MKGKNSKMVAGIAVILALLLGITAIAPVGSAEHEEMTILSDFDDYDPNAAVDTTYYQSAASSADFGAGEWGEFDLDSFVTVDVDAYFMFRGTDDNLIIKIYEEADSNNYISIRIKCESTTQTYVKVSDSWDGATVTDDKIITRDVYQDANGAWDAVEVKVAETDKSTDGTSVQIDVSIGDDEFIENFLLAGSGLSTDRHTRNWDRVKFYAHADNGAQSNFDNIDITTDSSSTHGWNYTWIIGLSTAGILIIGWHQRWYPKWGGLDRINRSTR